MQSPCVKICVIDPAAGLCTGCLRTLDEIARWGSMTPAERRAIMAKLDARRSGIEKPPAPHPPGCG
ncbi:MAG: DUF1289 domain-containing protein [Paracoccus sp. (in: a-proteobacteria)]|nr:DUF1289 domain-containing protein [Paracoccus sp. (in: a-proteobacteria)]